MADFDFGFGHEFVEFARESCFGDFGVGEVLFDLFADVGGCEVDGDCFVFFAGEVDGGEVCGCGTFGLGFLGLGLGRGGRLG